jgi:predicted HTH transcriptional regulator
MKNQTIDIHNLTRYSENNRIEAKRAQGGLPQSIWETYSAFANTEGGLILLGVEETETHQLTAVGVKDSHKLISDFWNTIHNHTKVNFNLLTDRMVNIQEVEGKEIVTIEVPRADRRHRPVYIGADPMRGTYRRNFEGDYLCDTEEVAAMFRDASNVSMDQRVLVNMELDVIDPDTLHRYRNRFKQSHFTHKWNEEGDDVFMRRIGATALSTEDGRFHPTLAGLLMFGREYDIVRECPHYFLDYQEKLSPDTRWTHRLVSISGDWSGNVYDFFFSVYPRLVADLPKPFITDGLSRLEETPLHLALREVLLNQLVHADYYGRQGIVTIKSRDEITLSNPGDIRIGLDVAMEGGISDPRNESMMKMFALIEIGERAGTGIPDFTHTWKTYEGEEPKYRVTQSPDRTHLTIPLKMLDSGRVAEKMSDKKSKVYPDTSEQGPDTLGLYPDTSEQGLDTFKQGPDTPGIKLSDKQKEVINFCSIPRSSKEILEHIGLSYHSKNRATYIISLVNAGYLKRTNPNTTDAYNQKYKRE